MIKVEVKRRVEKVYEEMRSVVHMICGEHAEFRWTEVVKRGRNVKTSILVVKAPIQENKGTDFKD